MSNVQTQGTSYTLNIVLLMECSDLEYHRTIGFWGKSSWDNNAAGLTQKNMRCCIGTETVTTYLNVGKEDKLCLCFSRDTRSW